MAFLNFAKFVLVLNVVGTVTATPCEESVNIFSNDRAVSVQNLSPCSTSVVMIDGEKITVPPLSRVQRSLHHMSKRSTVTAEGIQGRSDSLAALQETGKLLQMATMLPAETLQVLRMVAVPLLNTTLAVPENILKGVATMSLGKEPESTNGQARSFSDGVWQTLANLKPRKSLFLQKKITLGPLTLNKVVDIGTSKKEATTLAPEVVPETTPLPVAVYPVTAAPPVAVVPLTTPPPMEVVPATTSAPIDMVAETTVPPSPIAATPAPASVIPVVAAPGAVVTVTAPQPPGGDSTKQVVIVQNSPPAAGMPEEVV